MPSTDSSAQCTSFRKWVRTGYDSNGTPAGSLSAQELQGYTLKSRTSLFQRFEALAFGCRRAVPRPSLKSAKLLSR